MLGTNYACLGLRWATWAGRRGQRGLHFYNPGGHVGCILRLSWLTLGHMGGPSWAKRVTFLGTAPTLGYMGGPSWPKRVAFLGTAPGSGGHVGCILGVSWLTLGHMGGRSWPKMGAFLGAAPGPGGHV